MSYKSSKIATNKEYRFLIEKAQIDLIKKTNKYQVDKNHQLFTQLFKVLRAKQGDKILFQEKKYVEEGSKTLLAHCQVVEVNKSKIDLQCISFSSLSPNTKRNSLTICYPNQPQKIELIAQKATELGIDSIQLIESDFSTQRHKLKTERIKKIIEEAVEQSERANIPEFKIITDNLSEYLKKSKKSLLVALERDKTLMLNDYLPIENTEVIIGPEGGFSQNEKDLIKSLEIKTFSLGSNILRLETAAIVSAGIIML